LTDQYFLIWSGDIKIFKGWKNFLFIIILVCLLLLQASFLLVDTGCIKVDQQAAGGEPAVMSDVTGLEEKSAEPVTEEPKEIAEPAQESTVETAEPAKAVEAEQAAEPEKAAEPEETNEPEKAAEPEETSEPEKVAEPVEVNEPEQAVEPNETEEPNKPAEEVSKALGQNLQRAIAWPPTEFLSGITFEFLSWVIRVTNAVLILAATLYCLSMLFSLKVSMLGRLGGINHISRAFFLSLLMLILLLPWQRIFGGMVPGAIYTPDELLESFSAKNGDVLHKVIYYLRFSGYWLLILLLLILSQIRSIRWGKAILRRLEII
jgi:hypothetical protein